MQTHLMFCCRNILNNTILLLRLCRGRQLHFQINVSAIVVAALYA